MKIEINRDELVTKQGNIEIPEHISEYKLSNEQQKQLVNTLLDSTEEEKA